MKGTASKSSDAFATFAPDTPVTSGAVLDARTLDDLTPTEAAIRLVDFHGTKSALRGVTRDQKIMVIGHVLAALASRGIKPSTVTETDMATYRAWLAHRVEQGTISTSYAAHITQTWNATMRAALGDDSNVGEGLIMRGFPQEARKVKRWDENDFNIFRGGAERLPVRIAQDKEAFITYLEVNWCAGARPESLREAVFENIDYEKQVLHLDHMKNRPEHDVVLTKRAAARLKWWEDYVRETKHWKGRDATPILVGSRGTALTGAMLNRRLKETAALVGYTDRVFNYVVRKSVGTHIGKSNPRLAADQLGITMKIFEAHYNQPDIHDRMERRDILPGGSTWTPRSPEEIVGHAYLEAARGRISRADLEAALVQAERMRAQPGRATPGVDPYA